MLPALTSSLSPNRIQLSSLGRRSCTIPFTPEENTRISPYWAWASPPTVAMSLSTVSTSPISSGVGAGSQRSTAWRMRGRMSFSPGSSWRR